MTVHFVIQDIINHLPKNTLCIAPDRSNPKLNEHRNKWQGISSLIVCPRNIEQIRIIIEICAKHKFPITVQGGNTGVVGGQIPDKGAILLSMENMSSIESVCVQDMTVIAQSGATIESINNACKKYNLFLPIGLPKKATIGGSAATNAGGIFTYKYGMTRNLILGLQYLLSNTSLQDNTDMHKKSNLGIGTDHLLIGSEGTLGVITKVKAQLHPLCSPYTTLILFYKNMEDIMQSLNDIEHTFSTSILSIELMDPNFRMINSSFSNAFPHSQWILMILLSNLERETVTTKLSQIHPFFISYAFFHDNEADKYWEIRHNLSHMQKIHPYTSVKNDLLIPKEKIAPFFNETYKKILSIAPNVISLFFGHVGEGNIHYDILIPKTCINKQIYIEDSIKTCLDKHQGSSIGEHGIGKIQTKKIIYKLKKKNKYNLDLLIKRTLDPHNIFNPCVLW